jgi:hypothetical protein
MPRPRPGRRRVGGGALEQEAVQLGEALLPAARTQPVGHSLQFPTRKRTEVDRTVGQLCHGHPEQAVGTGGREVDLDAVLVAVVLGNDGRVMQSRHEGDLLVLAG